MNISKKDHDKIIKKYNLNVVEESYIVGLIDENSALIEKSTKEDLSEDEVFRTKEIAAELGAITKSVVMEENSNDFEKSLVYTSVYTAEEQLETKESSIEKSVDEEGKEIEQVPVSVYRNTQMNRSLERVGQEVKK